MKQILLPISLVIVATFFVAYIFRSESLNADVREDRIILDDTSRICRIVVPRNLPQRPPVVVAFHGIGDSPGSMANYSQWDQMAAANGFILVYPAASKSMWTTTAADLSDLDSNPDVQLFDKLLDHLGSIEEIDRHRIYVIGMSNGATFAQLLATARSEKIAAVVAHSGSRLKGLPGCERPFPIMLVVGADDLESSGMKSDADQYRSNGHSVEYLSVARLAHAWSTGHNDAMWQFLSQHVLN